MRRIIKAEAMRDLGDRVGGKALAGQGFLRSSELFLPNPLGKCDAGLGKQTVQVSRRDAEIRSDVEGSENSVQQMVPHMLLNAPEDAPPIMRSRQIFGMDRCWEGVPMATPTLYASRATPGRAGRKQAASSTNNVDVKRDRPSPPWATALHTARRAPADDHQDTSRCWSPVTVIKGK